MVGKTAALGMKKIVPRPQGADEIPPVGNIFVGRALQAAHPGVERHRLIDCQGLVRAKGGKNARGHAVSRDLFVMGQIIGWIIRGANGGDVEFFQDATCGEFGAGQLFVGFFPNSRGALLIQQFVDAKVAFEFQMSPVIERIAQGVRHRRRPGAELGERFRRARAEVLRNSVGPHGAPFVMVAFQPDFKEVAELPVFGDVPG